MVLFSFFNTSGSGSKLYYAFRAIGALKVVGFFLFFVCLFVFQFVRVTWMRNQTHEKKSSSMPLVTLSPEGDNVSDLKTLTDDGILQWKHKETFWGPIFTSYSPNSKIAALHVDEKKFQFLLVFSHININMYLDLLISKKENFSYQIFQKFNKVLHICN